MEEFERAETVEIDNRRFITLEFSRRWPKYVVAWSVRQKSGDSDFPLADGEVERLPENKSVEAIEEELRSQALEEANQAAGRSSTDAGDQQRGRSLLRRIFGGS